MDTKAKTIDVPSDRIEAAGGDAEVASLMWQFEQAGIATFETIPPDLPPDTVIWAGPAVTSR